MANLIEVTDLLSKNIESYHSFNKRCFNSLVDQSKKLSGKTIIHINATAQGGGVAEMLVSQIPLERSLGLDSKWFIIQAGPEFFEVTKKMHNLSQGESGGLTEKEKEIYLNTNKELGNALKKILAKFDSGIVIIHDPQPLALIDSIPSNFSSIFRLHIDISTPNPSMLEFFRPYIEKYSYIILSNEIYASSMPWLNKNKVKIIYPAIDPMTDKNKMMAQEIAWNILEEFGINPSKPLIAQISRFDPWKDPVGVIRAYYLAKNSIPELQLILAGFIVAQDDPEAEKIFKTVEKHAKGDPDIFLFANPDKLGTISNDLFINAVYTVSTVMVQKSIREGFGLTMTEAMLKGKAVIAGTTLGSLAQIKNNKNGILVTNSKETAQAIVKLIKDENLRQRLGKEAHKSVINRFTILSMLLDYIKLYSKLS